MSEPNITSWPLPTVQDLYRLSCTFGNWSYARRYLEEILRRERATRDALRAA